MRVLRPSVSGNRQMVSSGHYLATMAGHAVLEAGGNAVDAGCAAGIALSVVQTDLVNFAGVAPIIVRMANVDRPVSIAGLGRWPRSLNVESFISQFDGTIPMGVSRTVVPAAPDAWIAALHQYGTFRFSDVVEAAIGFARDGFAVNELIATTFREKEADYRRWPDSASIYLPGGEPPAKGARFIQQDLAATLQYMADEDRASGADRRKGLKAARDAFYRGDIAERIVRHQMDEGGYLSRNDLSAYSSPIEECLSLNFHGRTVYTCGPWCQGPTLLQALSALSGVDLRGLGHNSVEYIHLLTEVLKRVFWDRERYFGDPDFVSVPIRKLLSAAYGADLISRVSPDAAQIRDHGGGDAQDVKPSEIDPDTSYVCAVDRWGNAFSATPSDASWEAPVTPGLGIVPSTRGSQSRLERGHPAVIAPCKRPRLTPNPALAVAEDGTVMPFGSPGGDVQVQAMLQVLLNMAIWQMSPQEAVEHPRFATYSFPSSFYPFTEYPGLLKIESRIPQRVSDGLSRLGHKVENWPDWTWLAGGVCTVIANPEERRYLGGADPRRPSYAVGW